MSENTMAPQALETQLIDLALSCGAAKAVILNVSDIVLSADFREVCERNSCGLYNKCWACPPDNGDIEELMARVRTYSKALWYQSICEIEDSYDIEGMNEGGQKHMQLSQTLEAKAAPLLSGASWHLSCGGCRLCERCAKRDGQPCRFPDKMMTSLEGVGVDVYKTTKPTPLKYINGQNTVTYFGMILFG